MSGDGLEAGPTPQHVLTYYFHLDDPALDDTLCISQDDFVLTLFVDPDNVEYIPVWPGDVCIDPIDPPDPRDIIENPINGHSYEFVRVVDTTISWHAAVAEAGRRGGYLATITDSVEADIVKRLLRHLSDDAWLGGSDSAQEGTWTWITRERWDYTNWYGSEPNGPPDGYDYLMARALLGGRWMDAQGECRGFIVERDGAPPLDEMVNLQQWPVSEGGNDHWYAVIPYQQGWFDAADYARRLYHEGVVGHLATVTSADENSFIADRILSGPMPDTSLPAIGAEFWLGGFAAVDWGWATGEHWDYTNWLGGLPPDLSPDPDDRLALAMVGPGFCATPPTDCGKWVARIPTCDVGNPECKWAVVEFGTDDEPPNQWLNMTQWPISEGGNDHWYALVTGVSSWSEAKEFARVTRRGGQPGHLATVSSPDENDFIRDSILRWPALDTPIFYGGNHPRAWLGGYDLSNLAGHWLWTTDEPWDYTNWSFGQPNGPILGSVLAMMGGPGSVIPEAPLPGEWLAVSPNCDPDCPDLNCCAAIIEFDTDPGPWGSTLLVPQQYPTIQAAINAASNGERVEVSEGTYHESINFKGKAISVISVKGPLNTTITADRTANLVTFDHGEGARSELRGFTLRGGWMAVVCSGSGPTISHNVCVDQNVWNWAAIVMGGNIHNEGDPTGDPRYTTGIGPAPAILINNTIVGSANGGISNFSSIAPTIRNNIVAFNTAYGYHQQTSGSQPQPIIGYNDFYGNPHGNYNITGMGPGAISADPKFLAHYTLDPQSPCVEAGDPASRYNDPDGSRNDMGAVWLQTYIPDPVVIPTDQWIVVYCGGPSFPNPDPERSVILAWDPDGVPCGVDRVDTDGSFGFMAIYRDDPYTARDEGAEPGDLITFSVDGEMYYSTPSVYWTTNGDTFEVCEFATELCLDINLYSGWNLVSWNVDFNSEINAAFASIMGCLDVVHSFELGALVFDPGLDAFSTLTHVDPYHGYWVRVNRDTTLQICGEPILRHEAIGCEPGWNLVSYWPPEALAVENALASIMPHLMQVMGFDIAAQVWMAGMEPFNSLKVMRPKFGYWTKVDSWLPLVYPGFVPMDCTSADIVVRDRNDGATSSKIEPTRSWMSVYGDELTLDNEPLHDGVRIEFRVGDAVCGEGVYSGGILKMTPIYGFDASGEKSKLYAEMDDAISMFIDDQQVYPDLAWAGDGARVRLSSLNSGGLGLPQTFALAQNYPNPFNPSTTISFDLPVDGHVSLSIYNVLGQKVATVADQHYAAGRWEVAWNGDDDDGDRVATGIYFYRLTMSDEVRTRKMMLLK
jgi:hypothetical protein